METNKEIPTAFSLKDILNKYPELKNADLDCHWWVKMFIAIEEYTKLHLSKQAEVIAEKAALKHEKVNGCNDHTPYRGTCGTCGHYVMPTTTVASIDQQSILQASEEYVKSINL